MALQFTAADTLRFAASHDETGAAVAADCAADAGAAPLVGAALGPAASTLTAAVERFTAELAYAGDAVADRFAAIAGRVRAGAYALTATDDATGADFTAPGPTTLI